MDGFSAWRHNGRAGSATSETLDEIGTAIGQKTERNSEADIGRNDWRGKEGRWPPEGKRIFAPGRPQVKILSQGIFQKPVVSVILLLGAALGPIEGVKGQVQSPQWDFGLRASFSRSCLDHASPYEKKWGESWGAQTRFYFLRHFHAEVSFVRILARERKNCAVGWCDTSFRFYKPLAAFTVGGGLQARIGDWIPFAGVGRGRIWNPIIDRQAWALYSGLEFSPVSHLSCFGEYRVIRAKWQESEIGWSWAFGFGLGWRFRGETGG